MKLIKTTFLSGIITFVKISAGFISTKVIANLVGPAGVAVVGAFTNFITIVLTFANGAINNGVIKYTAEYSDNSDKTQKLFSTAFKLSLYCSLAVGVFLIFFSKFWSSLIFNDEKFFTVILLLGVCILFYSLNSLLIAILNGLGQIKTFTIVNALGSVIGLVLTIVLVYFLKLIGALYALVLSQTIIFFVSLLLVIKQKWLTISSFKGKFDKEIFRNLSQYSLMAIITALTVPMTQIIIRNLVSNKLNFDDAGIWQGMIKISDGYLLVINTALTTYYLPKLSSLKIKSEIRQEIIRGYKTIIPVTLIICVAIYFLRFLIIDVLYNESFIKMESLFFWQLLGDFFKILSYLLAYLMLAKAMSRVYIITEILFSISYIAFSYIFLNLYGLQGSAIAFFVNYFIYFIVMLILFRKEIIE